MTVFKARTTSGEQLPEGYKSFPNHNVAYKIYDDFFAWENARNRCISDGADLAIMDTREKIQYIQKMNYYDGSWLHVGISKPANHVEWKSVEDGKS